MGRLLCLCPLSLGPGLSRYPTVCFLIAESSQDCVFKSLWIFFLRDLSLSHSVLPICHACYFLLSLCKYFHFILLTLQSPVFQILFWVSQSVFPEILSSSLLSYFNFLSFACFLGFASSCFARYLCNAQGIFLVSSLGCGFMEELFICFFKLKMKYLFEFFFTCFAVTIS